MWSRSGLALPCALNMSRAFIQAKQSASATQAPVIEAVRVPPSAWMTSQSMVIWRSPMATRSTTERKERPIRRWISTVRPPCLPAEASRRVRSLVARGSMPYSAVTQPRPWPLSHGGRRSSRLAVTRTWVSPNFTKHEPSAYFTTPRSSETGRNSSTCRRLGRIWAPGCLAELAAFRWGGPPRQALYCVVFMDNSAVATEQGTVSQDIPLGPSQAGLAQLNERSREIFRQIVESYLATGEPVGSRNLARIIPMPLSPASVRNVMADLEQL